MSKPNDKKNEKNLNSEKSENNKRFINYLFYGVAIFFFITMLRYYFTGAGGPTLLVVGMVPVAYILATLDSMRKNEFYPSLNKNLRYILGSVLFSFPW